MSILNQKTINHQIEFKGITLHKGKFANMRIIPSPPNTGIVFKRTDLKVNNIITNYFNVRDAILCTTLR